MASYFLGYILLLILDFVCQGRNLRAEALKIDGLEERVLKAGSNFLLSCHANETITWRYPSSMNSETKFSQITKETLSGYTALLTVESSDYLATGFYDCVGVSEEASVYVYVFDEDHLLAVNPVDIFLIGRQYQDIVVPCKPTSPDVNVSLTYHDKAVQGIEKFGASYKPYIGYILNGIDSDGFHKFHCVGHINNVTSDYVFFIQVLAVDIASNDFGGGLHPVHTRELKMVKFSKYDPKLGFTISNITLLDSDVVTCTGTKGDNEESEDFVITINTESETAPQPEIQDTSIQHFVVGQDVTLHCFVKIELGLPIVMDWILPETANLTGRYTVSNNTSHRHPEDDSGAIYWGVSLTLTRVVKEDEGNYTCRLKDYSNNTNSDTKYLKIYSKDDSFINISVRSKKIEVDASLGETAKWVITVTAHPNVELHWYGPDDNEIPRSMAVSDKYQIRETRSQTILEILDVQLQDAGNYTLIASNAGGKEVVILQLIVLDKPIVSFDYSRYYRINVPTKVSCFVEGYPTPYIHWKFRRCNFTHGSHCSEFETLSAMSENITELQISDSHILSSIIWNMQEPGELSCTAQNDKGSDTELLPVLVTDVPEGFLMGKTPGEIVEGDNLTLACAVTAYEYWDNLWWVVESEGSKPMVVDKRLVSEQSRNYSYWSKIEIKNVKTSNSGNYTCKAYGRENSTVREETITIKISKIEAPEIIETNLPNEEMTISSWQPITWKCAAKGVPSPSIYWLKDDDVLVIEDDFSNFELLENNSTLSIKSLTMEEEGKYTCKAKNKGGEVEAFVYLKLKENHKTNTTLVISVVVVAVLLIIVLVSFFYALWKMAKEKEELRIAGLQNFKKGMTKSINQGLTLDQQTDLLPYDPKWEFPSSKLKLGEQLGAGAFGVVLKANAYGIVEEGEWTTVAVKMVKPHADPAYVRALVSELKILAHLGKHLNVVNLLGACTKNYMKKELLVIVEYCKKGNAHNYILRHRHKFIDQIDPATGEIDITKRNSSENYNRIRINYATLTFPRSVDSDPNSALTSLNTEMTCLSSERLGGDSLNGGPDWCADVQDYRKYDLDELSTSTLICWSFQVARGMEYLASRRVLHGDLAARNVLIADNNIVKICDFGFAKNIYSHPEYQKTGDGPVPVKWMAIESITRRIFSTQSDVWSFGIVLWEFFSLAKTPYPGFENYESILKKLESGYRMEKPLYANQTLYDIMMECWDQQPCRRPSFSELAMKLGKLLESNVREHYIQLNEPFQKQTIPEEEDYLSMMSPPNYDPPTSHYVNEPIGKPNQNSDGYLCMRSSSWSPVMDKDGNSEDNIEMKPMLPDKDKNEENLNDDYLIPRQKPATSDCAFNPSYIMSRTVSNKPQSQYGKINKP